MEGRHRHPNRNRNPNPNPNRQGRSGADSPLERMRALMRYNDDFEFLLDAGAGVIQVRSASRVGYGDMGVNRERIETVRAALVAQGVVAAP